MIAVNVRSKVPRSNSNLSRPEPRWLDIVSHRLMATRPAILLAIATWCGGGPLLTACLGPGDRCAVDLDCSDNSICFEQLCRVACNSSAECPLQERCRDGVCRPDTDAVQCRDDNPCTSDDCSNQSTCVNTATPDISCPDEGNDCTEDRCSGATCVMTAGSNFCVYP